MNQEIEIIVKLFASFILAGIIGLEREFHGRAAGLRTHILVCVGSCLIMLTSVYIHEAFKDAGPFDPARIAAGVVTGIGFLGAGTILRFRGSVIGLTTAASIWTSAAIGLAIGAGFYYGALIATFFVLVTLFLISRLEIVFVSRTTYKTLIVTSDRRASIVENIRKVLSRHKVEITDIDIEKDESRNTYSFAMDIKLTSAKYNDNIILNILELEGVRKANWE